jgi:hypothetical protein
MRRIVVAIVILLLGLEARPIDAWPASLTPALVRDARRLLPRSLARVLAAREEALLARTRLSHPLAQAIARDQLGGRLEMETLIALDAELKGVVSLFEQRRVSDGLIQFGTLIHAPADLADPAICSGPAGLPAGVAAEYYAFIEGNLDRIPVVLTDAAALETNRQGLAAYWQRVLQESQGQAPILAAELYRNGRVVDHRAVDYRSPAFAVASLSYSRAVTAIAATWLAVWREAGGDQTLRARPRTVTPTAMPDPRGRTLAPQEARQP